MAASGTSEGPLPANAPQSAELRTAGAHDLEAINTVIDRAVMGWDLPERVKRLALPLYRYNDYDLRVMQFRVAEIPGGGILGVAAWEDADPRDLPAPQGEAANRARHGVLLHGLYIDPAQQRSGLGTRLLAAVGDAARATGARWLLVKAQNGAEGFFERRGLVRLPVRDTDRDYEGRYLLDLHAA